MLQYLKLLLISFICSIFTAFPASGAGHFAYLNNVLNFTQNKNEAVFYVSIVSLVFSATSLFFVRKLYFKGVRILSGGANASKAERANYKNMFICVLITVVASLIMLIPYGKGKLLSDIFGSYLCENDMLVVAASSVLSGLISVAAIWYSKQKSKLTRKNSGKADVVRMTVYSSLSAFFPGFSRVSAAADSLIVSGIDEGVVIRDVLLYTAPPTFTLSVIRIVRCIISGVSLDPVMLAVCVGVSLLGSIISLNLMKKVNIRSVITFFSIYSVLLGILTAVTSFVLN